MAAIYGNSVLNYDSGYLTGSWVSAGSADTTITVSGTPSLSFTPPAEPDRHLDGEHVRWLRDRVDEMRVALA